MLKIYNSFTQQKEEFKPLEPGKVKMYVCGMTVYDYCHMGHARMLSSFDVIVRYLKWRGFSVYYARNITDIDDKIIKRANENHEDFRQVTARFIQAMNEDIGALNLLAPTHEPCATECISDMISLIEKLIVSGYAYVAENGDVYYNVRSFKNYGALSHRDIEQLMSGARVEVSDIKWDPLDFVLWKLAKPEEPYWDSPWGKGRPGWHIECSAMAMRFLGEQFDIHGGGKDLIFPHHENEIAQSEAVTQKKFANLWMHVGYLQTDKEKMSKSLGNFFTIRDLLPKFSGEVIRYFLIASHYRSPLQYSEDLVQQSQHALERFYKALRGLPIADFPVNSIYEQKIIEAMNDDFNVPIAFSVLFELSHEIQRLRETDLNAAAQHAALLRHLGAVFGILQDDPDNFLKIGFKGLDVDKIEKLIMARNVARAQKQWAEADRIRNELLAMSVVLEDGVEGTTWRVGC
jgi:cysteinyl-tRNA synthetase